MMLTRPLTPAAPPAQRKHSESPMSVQEYQTKIYPKQRPIIRTASFGFKPRVLPPVNKVVGSPRLYG